MHPTPPFVIRPMRDADVEPVSQFIDRTLGPGYMPADHLRADLARATAPGPDGEPVICAHVAVGAEGRLAGFRVAFPPGRWSHGRGDGITPSAWPAPLERCGYFQTIVVDPACAGQGLGRRMSMEALAALRRLGTEAVITHSWLESPHNSSQRYLKGLGFEAVATYPRYWEAVDYTCVRCGRPCLCTAVEMALAL